MDFTIYETFIMNKARDLEVSLFNYFFDNNDLESCLLALTLYINEDGGISNIDPFNNNKVSTLASTLYFFDILNNINYKLDDDNFNEILKEVIKFLRKQKSFSFNHKTNSLLECDEKFMDDTQLFELVALSYAYILKYSKFNDCRDKLNELINTYLELKEPTFNQVLCFKKVQHLTNNELLKNKIITDCLFYKDKLNELVLSDDDFILEIYYKELNLIKESLLNNRVDSLWYRTQKTDSMKEEVANIKYMSIDIVNNLLFMKRVNNYETKFK